MQHLIIIFLIIFGQTKKIEVFSYLERKMYQINYLEAELLRYEAGVLYNFRPRESGNLTTTFSSAEAEREGGLKIITVYN